VLKYLILFLVLCTPVYAQDTAQITSFAKLHVMSFNPNDGSKLELTIKKDKSVELVINKTSPEDLNYKRSYTLKIEAKLLDEEFDKVIDGMKKVDFNTIPLILQGVHSMAQNISVSFYTGDTWQCQGFSSELGNYGEYKERVEPLIGTLSNIILRLRALQ